MHLFFCMPLYFFHSFPMKVVFIQKKVSFENGGIVRPLILYIYARRGSKGIASGDKGYKGRVMSCVVSSGDHGRLL